MFILKIASVLITVLHLSTAMAASPSAKLNELNWMAGKWKGEFNGMPMESYYSDSAGGMILGQTKMVNGTTMAFFEFEKIEQVDASLVLQPFPFAQPGVTFALKEMQPNRVVFENPKHDFPTRIIYELKPDGQLLARIEGMQNGVSVAQEFLFSKVK